MITQRAISGVCFCTLQELLDSLCKIKNIDYWFAIEHLPEGDECHKLHCHYFLVPSGRVDTVRLRDIIPHSLPLRTSKEGDWLLYALHDPEYLVSHCLTKERHYNISDLHTSLSNSKDVLQALYSQAKEGLASTYSRISSIRHMANQGLDWSTVIGSGVIPPNQFQFYKELYTQFFISRQPGA